jgi:hypothetical protein
MDSFVDLSPGTANMQERSPGVDEPGTGPKLGDPTNDMLLSPMTSPAGSQVQVTWFVVDRSLSLSVPHSLAPLAHPRRPRHCSTQLLLILWSIC